LTDKFNIKDKHYIEKDKSDKVNSQSVQFFDETFYVMAATLHEEHEFFIDIEKDLKIKIKTARKCTNFLFFFFTKLIY